jgi:quinol monooxygenase YgiN
MNTVLARFKILPGKETQAEEAMKTQAASVESGEPGALAYIFHRNSKDPSEITVFEIYADDDASNAHRGTEHMTKFASYFGSLFDPASVKIERLERIAGFNRSASDAS